MITAPPEIWTLRDLAAALGETPATARAKMSVREAAGFPKPLPRLFPHERYKWPADEVRAWIEAMRAGVPVAANDRGGAAGDQREANRARLMARL